MRRAAAALAAVWAVSATAQVISQGSPGGATVAADAAAPDNQTATGGDWSANDFLTGGKAGTMVRSSYFNRTKPNENGPAAEAWGLGGWLYGETGELAKMLSFGGAYYYVAPLYAPDDGGGNFILKDPGQDGYGVLGEAWVRLRYGDNALTVGRQALSFGWSLDGIYRTYNRFDGSFIGRRDVRAMLPLDFESANVAGKLANDTFRYYGGYAWLMRQVNADKFDNLSTAAFLPEEDSAGMSFIGAQWKITNDLMLQGSYHSVQNLAHLGIVDLDSVYRMGEGRYLRFDTQYIYQSSNRPGLPPTPSSANAVSLYGTAQDPTGDISTWNWAGYFEARWWQWWIPYAMIGVTSDHDEIRSPYSLGPSYLVQRIGENAKAGEHTWIIGSTFDFASLKVPGLSFDATYGQRTHRHVQLDSSKPLAQWDELATDLIYSVPDGWAKGLRLRARWARVWETGNQYTNGEIIDISQQTTDLRFDLQWLIPFK